MIALVSCSKLPIAHYTLVLVQDSSNESKILLSQLKAAKLAIEKFNAKTNINTLNLTLEVLDLAKQNIASSADLQSYIHQLQHGKLYRSVIIGFVIVAGAIAKTREPATFSLPQFQKILKDSGSLLVGSWPFPPEGTKEYPLQLNVAEPAYASNSYFVQYIINNRKLDNIYIVYDAQHRGIADDFILRSNQHGLQVAAKLLYVAGSSDYAKGRIQSLSALLSVEKNVLRGNKQRNGIVLFLNQSNFAKNNAYLSESPYRYFFDNFDILLNNDQLDFVNSLNPKVARYFVFQQQEFAAYKKYQNFISQYGKIYHLNARKEAVELYDVIGLLSYAAKKTIEESQIETTLAQQIYQNLLDIEFEGATGNFIFNTQGQRIANYPVFQWTSRELKTLGYFSGLKGLFINN